MNVFPTAPTRYPGQENAAGNFKIPSILYYNPDGTVHSVGAEAAVPGMELEASDKNLIFVDWYVNSITRGNVLMFLR